MDNLWEEDNEYPDELCHYGVPDMVKGRRRYQNPDGSLTPEGKIHYGIGLGIRAAKRVGSAAVKTGKIGLKQAYRAGRDIQESNISSKERAKRRLRDAKLANQKDARRMREVKAKRVTKALTRTLSSLKLGKKKEKEKRWEWASSGNPIKDKYGEQIRNSTIRTVKDTAKDVAKHPVYYTSKTLPGANLLNVKKRKSRR